MTQVRGKLFLLASPIAEEGLGAIPQDVRTAIHNLRFFIVERERTARRYIRALQHPQAIDDLTMEEMPQDAIDPKTIDRQMQPLLTGQDIGILSEAGFPAIADPGSLYVAWAQRKGIDVIPCSGPSSLMMALMASGLEGQRFAFHGYLPAKKEELGKHLKDLEARADRDKATQIFIETPYRNQQVMEAAGKFLYPERMFCIAADLGSANGFVKTKKVKEWIKDGWPSIHKVPCVFLLK